MTKRILALAALGIAAAPSFATDLWNQQVGVGSSFDGGPDQVFGDLPSATAWQASDVIVGSGGWNVTSISTLATLQAGGTMNLTTTADLTIFAGSASLPTGSNDPSVDQVVNVTWTLVGANEYRVQANVNMNLAAGHYWVGLTPIGDYGTYLQTYTIFTSTNSAGASFGTGLLNPGGYYNGVTTWQTLASVEGQTNPLYAAIDIQGTAAPEPATMAFLGLGIAGLVARRRLRK
ncbi:MAG TPA: PEP-CTERM sorting domain-containing protein [Fimbriimonadaceae bacterium]|nr:PEP-CTERM sorting domain-containing protein [Fimbriimonadaceae bacterium]